MKISVCINLDSRPGVADETTNFNGHNDGCRNWDFFTHGVENKRRFFAGFDIEVIAYADESVAIPAEVLAKLREICDAVVIRKHFVSYRNYDFAGFANDIRYLQCLFMATGDTIIHYDADAACFAREKRDVDRWLGHLDSYRFVSYFSDCTPKAVFDQSFGKHTWASTRAFATRREWIKFDVLERMLREPEWGWQQFGEPLRKTNWLEHMLALSNEESVFYPPREDDRTLMFCWGRYHEGVLGKLNDMPFDQVRDYVQQCHGIHYPCDVSAKPL